MNKQQLREALYDLSNRIRRAADSIYPSPIRIFEYFPETIPLLHA